MEEKEIKVVKSFSLRPSRISWLAARAFELSTPTERVSDSQLLDDLLSAVMEEVNWKRVRAHIVGKAPAEKSAEKA